MIKRIIRFGSATVVSFAFVGSMAAAQGISNTGFGSKNVVVNKNVSVCKNVNKNVASIGLSNVQSGTTGSASASGNTTSTGNVASGGVTNTHGATVSVSAPAPVTGDCPSTSEVSPCSDATIDNTGFFSTNKVVCKNVSVQKTVTVNSLGLSISNVQSGATGSANASGNTTVGSVSSGAVNNGNTVTITVGS